MIYCITTGNHMGLPLRNQMTYNVQHRAGAPPVWAPEKVSHMTKQMSARRCHKAYTDIARHTQPPCDITQHIMHTQSVGADRYGKLFNTNGQSHRGARKNIKDYFYISEISLCYLKA